MSCLYMHLRKETDKGTTAETTGGVDAKQGMHLRQEASWGDVAVGGGLQEIGLTKQWLLQNVLDAALTHSDTTNWATS